jgi:hypothetical protein
VDTDVHRSMFTNCTILIELLKPFLFRTGVITEDQLTHLHREATIEMLSDAFCGVWFLLSAWGIKP